ncbi:unnamed protein product [Blepharisma stoltei]|uniref:Uncharacterized protein n=1 Tax=Blepharisma stoltei TaxID=1481888 RepID=A0AAU9K6R4_9CILI|nr:unnamed protein product [Blepharisma stoltei]
MASIRCFDLKCDREIQYACKCSSPQTYSCEMHFGIHLKLPNRNHVFDSLFIDPCEGTKEAILEFLTKERREREKLKEKFLSSYSQYLCNSESSLKKSLKNLNSDLATISELSQKIFYTQKILKDEQDHVINLLTLQPDKAMEDIKAMIPSNPESYSSVNLFCGLSEEIEKMFECFIDEKFEHFFNKRLSNIENKLEEHDKIIKNEIPEVYNSIFSLAEENKKTKTKFEEWNQEIQLKTQKQVKSLASQLSSTLEELNKKLNEIKNNQDQFNKKVSDQLLIPQELKSKRSAILSKPNDPETEQDFRRTCSLYENSSCETALIQAYQKYTNAYHQKTSLYIIKNEDNNRTDLVVYDTEYEKEELKLLDYLEPLGSDICITQLPKGELFCFGDYPPSGVTFIIDENLRIQRLPSGTPCFYSSAIYFNKSVYCFGGIDNENALSALSCRFDFNRNQWISLTPIPEADYKCSSIVFKGNIIISGFENENIWRYSIDSNSFATIPSEFGKSKRKILINSERLYLIECEGFIYESEVGDEYTWNQITSSIIDYYAPSQVYCSYNKGGVYIGISWSDLSEKFSHCCSYYKFDFSTKAMLRL